MANSEIEVDEEDRVEKCAAGDEIAIGEQRYEVAEVLKGALRLRLEGHDAGVITYEELRARNAVRCSLTMAEYYSSFGLEAGVSVFSASMEAFIELQDDPARLHPKTRRVFAQFLQKTLSDAGRPELFGILTVALRKYFSELDARTPS